MPKKSPAKATPTQRARPAVAPSAPTERLDAFRNQGAFHEKVTNTIASHLIDTIDPRFLRIHADWFVRGGIRTYVTVEHRKKGWKPPVPVVLPTAQA